MIQVRERLFDRGVAEITRNMQVRDSGSYNSIPFPDSLSRLRTMIPGTQRANYVIVTANSGVGKSKFTKYFYVMSPHEFILHHQEAEMKLDTLYFCLEEPKVRFINTLICNRLYMMYQIRVDVKHLESINFERYLNQETLDKVHEMKDYFYHLEDHLYVIDDMRTPSEIFKTAKKFLEQNGKWTKKKVIVENGRVTSEVEVNDVFSFTHPNYYCQIIVDHYSLLQLDKGMKDLHQAISEWSSNYAIYLRNRMGASIVGVQQQAAEKEKMQWTVKGNAIEDKMEPSTDGMGDNKLTVRDCDEMIGVFSPNKYKIMNHRGYNIASLRDNYRSTSILKCRYGVPDLQTGMYFDGAVDYFEQLPPQADFALDEGLYERYVRMAGREPRVAGTISFS